jgi:ankyrin repeat protein
LHLVAGAPGDHATIAGVLIDHGADIEAADAVGWTALHAAADCGNSEIVRLLIEKGADVRRDSDKALKLAIAKGHNKIQLLLMNAGIAVAARSMGVDAGSLGLVDPDPDAAPSARFAQHEREFSSARETGRNRRGRKLVWFLVLLALCAAAVWAYLADPAWVAGIRKTISGWLA